MVSSIPVNSSTQAPNRQKTAFDYQVFLDEVYSRLTVDQVYAHVRHQFKQSGEKHRGGCPFHDSKSGSSFCVNENSFLFYCAGCQSGGSAADYLHSIKVGRWEQARGRDFIEAAKQLAELAGIPFPSVERSPEEIEKIRQWESRREVLQAVTEYGVEVLWSSRGIDARNYLTKERGFTEEQIKDLHLGLYLSRKEVEKVLVAKGYSLDDVKNAGVLWSKLEGYILFPWMDSQGRPLTIYGRYQSKIPPEGKPKTIALKGEDTKQSPLYFDRALQAGHKEIVLVEGVIDAALLQAKGDTRVCAYVAASCSEAQIKTLVKRGIKSVTLCGDPDKPGDNGTVSNINRIMATGIDVFVAPKLPDGLDPDEFVIREGMSGWEKHINDASHAFNHMARVILAKHDITTDRGKSSAFQDATAFEKKFTQPQHELSLKVFFWKEIYESLGIDGEDFHSGDGDDGGNGGDDGNGGNGDDGDDGNGQDNTNSDRHPEKLYRPICKLLKLDINNCVTNQTYDSWFHRQEFGGDEGNWWVTDSSFYHFDGKVWQHQPDNRILALAAKAAEKTYKLSYSDTFGWYAKNPYPCNSHKESAFKYTRSRLEREESSIANNHLLAFKNCVVDMRTGDTMPHDKNYFLQNIIPYDYEPGKNCPEVFLQFITQAFGADMVDVIRAFTSMFLDPTAPYGRFPHLIGQSGGGKGTLGRFWSLLFGESGSGNGSYFSDISTPEGRHQYLTGKRIFGFPDMGGYAEGVRSFYELIDNGPLSGRALFNPVAYNKQWNVKFWLASVDHLQIENAGDGWARRAYPIPVLNRNVQPDPGLGLKLEAVKADVISWALAMPREERDRILLSRPSVDRAINAALDASLYGDSTKSFVNLCLRPSYNAAHVDHHQLHTWYVAYCKEHGYTPLGMSKFVSHLKTILPLNFVDRYWGQQQDGERSRVGAHWEYLTPLAGAFTKIGGDEQYGSSQNSSSPSNPIWVCIKAKCQEGGLEEITRFWNPPEPPKSPEPSPSNGVQGVQGQKPTQNQAGHPETQSQQGCPKCPSVHPQGLDASEEEKNKKEIFEKEITDYSPPVGEDNLDTLDTRSVTGFGGVQGRNEPLKEDGQGGHPDSVRVPTDSPLNSPLNSPLPEDLKQVEANVELIRQAIADKSWQMICKNTKEWSAEFKAQVWGQLSPEERLAAKALKPTDSPTVLQEPVSLLQVEVDGGDISNFIGCQIEVRFHSGGINFTGKMTKWDEKQGIITLATSEGDRMAYSRECFIRENAS